MDDVAGDVVSGLIDLTGVDLADLEISDNPVLAGALQKIRDDVEHPDEAVAGFQSSL